MGKEVPAAKTKKLHGREKSSSGQCPKLLLKLCLTRRAPGTSWTSSCSCARCQPQLLASLGHEGLRNNLDPRPTVTG